MGARTHTYFFGEDQLEPLWKEYKALAADANARALHVGLELKAKMTDRLENLRIAIELLSEVAD